ncbi:MAG: alpha/beta hydrolase fold domain-containing protein [Pseudomonadales bacterium]|nr:alpha/beta hydrolase fold domain-containing protein [Pseudomonadales bacterium]
MPLAPEYAAMFEQLAAQEPGPPIYELSPADARELYRAMRPVVPELPVHKIVDQTITGSLGDIPVRIYTPGGDGPYGVLVYFHGGGWVIGDCDTCDAVCREISTLGDLVVVSVDYRMAPEDVYPASVIDAYDATAWASNHMADLNGNGKLGVAGESAGGNLSAAVSLKARDEDGPEIAFQCLLYPVTDSDLSRPSYAANGEGYILETATMAWFWDTYCPDQARRSEAHAAPLRAADLGNLPAALIVTAEFDPLRDEGEAFAEALKSAGNEAEWVRYDGMVHDFFGTAVVFESSRAGFLETVDALKTHLN